MQHLSRWFTQGALVLIPIAVTIVILRWIMALIETLTPFAPVPIWIKLVLALALVVLIGWMASFWGTRWLVHYSEALLARIPVVRTIYGSVKQMSEALADPEKFLGRAVLVPVGSERTLTLGFFVAPVKMPHSDAPWACVFVPMSLNITGGFNLFVPMEDVIEADSMDREEAFRFVLTAGAAMPKGFAVEASGQSSLRSSS